ncbi:MAG: hypothetical protein ACLRWQ_22575 [Flavonifractor plautii]
MEGWNMRCGWRPTAGYPRTRRISFTPLAAQQAYFEGLHRPARLALRGHFRRRGPVEAPPSAGPDSPSCSGWPGRGRWI